MRTKTIKKENWKVCWDAFVVGDMDAFHRIYVGFFDSLYNYGSKLTNDNAILEDSIQELFLQLYTKRDNLTNPDNLEYYLLKSLKFIIYQRYRKRSKLLLSGLRGDDSGEIGFIFEKEQQPNDYENDDNNEQLKILLSSLDTNQRELLYLKFSQGLSYKEIGNLLGIQPDSAKKQVYRIVARLRDKVKKSVVNLFLCSFPKR